jgi:hypothetical protein
MVYIYELHLQKDNEIILEKLWNLQLKWYVYMNFICKKITKLFRKTLEFAVEMVCIYEFHLQEFSMLTLLFV